MCVSIAILVRGKLRRQIFSPPQHSFCYQREARIQFNFFSNCAHDPGQDNYLPPNAKHRQLTKYSAPRSITKRLTDEMKITEQFRKPTTHYLLPPPTPHFPFTLTALLLLRRRFRKTTKDIVTEAIRTHQFFEQTVATILEQERTKHLEERCKEYERRNVDATIPTCRLT